MLLQRGNINILLILSNCDIFRWYHGTITGKEAETLLTDKGVEGSYLVRASTHNPGNYVLSARVHGEVAHVMIGHDKGKFDVGGGPSFSSLNELIEHYRSNPMIETSGRVITLKAPFNTTSFMAQNIGQRVKELEKESIDVVGKAGFWEEFEVCYDRVK